MRINSCNLLAALDISYISLPSFYSISPPLFTLDRSSPLILFLEISGTALSWFQSYLSDWAQVVCQWCFLCSCGLKLRYCPGVSAWSYFLCPSHFQICQHSSQPRCLSWSYSLFNSNFFSVCLSSLAYTTIWNFCERTIGLSALPFQNHGKYCPPSTILGLVHYATICPTMSPKEILFVFVLSRLDYCNSLLVGCHEYFLSKQQKVQNNAARLSFRTSRFTHVTPMLHSLHWLPIEQRIE